MSADLRLDQWDDLDVEKAVEDAVNSGDLNTLAETLNVDAIDAEGAEAFLLKHPDFPQTEFNGLALSNWCKERDVPCSVKNLEIGWADLRAKGLLEKAHPNPEPAEASQPKVIVRHHEEAEGVVEDDDIVVLDRDTGARIDVEAEVSRLESLARDHRVPDAIRRDADARIRLLVRTQISRSRSPRLSEQRCVV